MNQQLNILLLDDHSLYLKGLESIIKEAFPLSKSDSFSSIKHLKKHTIDFEKYDLFISDIELPGEDIFKLFTEIKKSFSVPILVVSMHKKLSVIRKCKSLNIEGYILKDDDELLIPAIRNLVSGNSYYSDRIEKFYDKLSNDQVKISIREEEILKLVCNGYSNQYISEQLHISVETVKTHKKNIKNKLGCNELNELIEAAKDRYLL